MRTHANTRAAQRDAPSRLPQSQGKARACPSKQAARAAARSCGTGLSAAAGWPCSPRPSGRLFVDEPRPVLPVLSLAHPHLLEGAQGGQDGAADPHAVPPLHRIGGAHHLRTAVGCRAAQGSQRRQSRGGVGISHTAVGSLQWEQAALFWSRGPAALLWKPHPHPAPRRTLTLAICGARSATSFSSRSRSAAKPAVPPVSTTPAYRSLRMSTSHLGAGGGVGDGGE